MSRRFASFVLVLLAAAGAGAQGADTTPDAAAERDPWPRVAQSASGTVTIYQPQVDAWQGNTLSFHAAVSIEAPGAKSTVFGVAFVTARTQVDKEDQLVTLDAFTVTRVRFPSIPDSQSAYLALLRGEVPKAARTISLPRLTASLQIVNDKSRAQSAPVKNAPPAILFSTVPAILVLIDGNPKLGPSPAAGLRRVINTGVLLAYDGELYWLRVFDGWMQATSIAGPWVVGWAPPASLDTLLTWARTQRIDLLTGASADPTEDSPSLWASTVPVITTSTTPAELIVSQGALDYVPIPGTDLLYASNTSARVFEYIDTQQMFVLLSGRWFSAPGTSGPWTYVPGSRLPNDFRDIPLDSPAEPVLASVPGTPQAREAVIDNSIPQTASVSRSATMPAPAIDGAPQMAPIAGTSLSYVLNSPIPIIRTAPGAYYAVYSGVWFAAPAPTGPWTVAASVPTSIYAIPPSSAVYYVTYVQVYGATSSVVYVGYTPGYFGTVVAPGGVVVYGTGYAYPVWIGAAYYPPPMTYGFGAAVAWTPYTGWAVTFGYGYSYGGVAVDMTFGGAYWGAHPYYGPAYYGPPVVARPYPVRYCGWRGCHWRRCW